MKIKLELEHQELDLIAVRMTAGTMEYSAALATNALLLKIQEQANDTEMNPRVLNVVEAVREAQERKES